MLSENIQPQKPIMLATDVVLFYLELKEQGISIWIEGGWGVDALLGRQTRAHSDLDIVIERNNVVRVRELLELRGWKILQRDDLTEHNFHLRDDKGREIDFHVIVLDDQGNGIYGPVERGEMYPADSLTGTGKIQELDVKCISPEWMVKFHSGYELKEKDFQDVSAICEKFGIQLPEEYNRFKLVQDQVTD